MRARPVSFALDDSGPFTARIDNRARNAIGVHEFDTVILIFGQNPITTQNFNIRPNRYAGIRNSRIVDLAYVGGIQFGNRATDIIATVRRTRTNRILRDFLKVVFVNQRIGGRRFTRIAKSGIANRGHNKLVLSGTELFFDGKAITFAKQYILTVHPKAHIRNSTFQQICYVVIRAVFVFNAIVNFAVNHHSRGSERANINKIGPTRNFAWNIERAPLVFTNALDSSGNAVAHRTSRNGGAIAIEITHKSIIHALSQGITLDARSQQRPLNIACNRHFLFVMPGVVNTIDLEVIELLRNRQFFHFFGYKSRIRANAFDCKRFIHGCIYRRIGPIVNSGVGNAVAQLLYHIIEPFYK